MGLYNDLFVAGGDKRLESWMLMRDPYITLSIIAVYLYGIYVYLPNYMKSRRAFELKLILQLYNVLQIIICTYMVYQFCTTWWCTGYSFYCQPLDFSNSPAGIKMLTLSYYTFLIKLFELVETCFFLLRHKQNQVSKLHVYHHISTLCIGWSMAKWAGGGMGNLPQMLNFFVHIIMYTYYFLAALGENVQNRLSWVKPKITIIQLAQFGIMIMQCVLMLNPWCEYNKYLSFVFFLDVLVLVVFFTNFYNKSYTKKAKAI